MTDVLPASALVFRRRDTRETLALDPALELGAGGEARVFAVPGDDSLVAKVYRRPTLERARKLVVMMEHPPALDPAVASPAWPTELLVDEEGRFAGFLMPRAEGPRVFELYNPVTRRKAAPRCHYGTLHRAAANLAAAFAALHAAGYVVGDVNESNFLVGPTGALTLVDCDSMQVRDPRDGTVFRSHVGKAEFTPPELQGTIFAERDRAPEHDRFGLAVLVFLLLMEGTHPFAARFRDAAETPPPEERIRRGFFPFGRRHPECRPPRLAPRYKTLPPRLRQLFARAFVDGHAHPAARPTAAEWAQALRTAEARLATCPDNAQHRYGNHLLACPWCERKERLHGRDPFPARRSARAASAVPATGAPEVVQVGPSTIAAPPAAASIPAPPAPASIPAPSTATPAPAPASPTAASTPAPAGLAAQPVPAQPAAPTPAVAILPQQDDWRAGLPPALRSILGPRALGHPLPWMLALFWVMVVASRPELMVPALLLAAVWQLLPGRRPVGIPTVFATLGLWMSATLVLAAVLWEPPPRNTYWDTLPPAPGAPAPPAPSPGGTHVTVYDPYSTTRVDQPPRLSMGSEAWVRQLEEAAGPGAPTGGVLLSVQVLADGSVEPGTASATYAADPALARAVLSVADRLRFDPLTLDGAPTSVRVGIPLRFDR